MANVQLVAEHLKGRTWTVSPDGQLGTCGSWPYLWTIEYVTASSAQEALRKATYAQAAFTQWQRTR